MDSLEIGDAGGKGRLHRGSVAHSNVQRTSTSIPTRFDTVLNTGTKEARAFGVSSHRFHPVSGASGAPVDNPGPGTYAVGSQVLPQEETSYSKTGYGGLASKTKRFDDVPTFNPPGPGQYTPVVSTNEMQKTNANGVGYSASFAPKVGPSVKRKPPPDPEYSHKAPPPPEKPMNWDKGPRAARVHRDVRGFADPSIPSASFKSGTQRNTIAGRKDLPGPGSYDVGEASTMPVLKKPLHHDEKLPSASFRSSTRRQGIAATEATDVNATTKNANSEDLIPPPVVQRRESPSRPDPFIYTTASASAKKNVRLGGGFVSHTASSIAFLIQEKKKEKKRNIASQIIKDRDVRPGPGSYELVPKSAERQGIGSAAFMSGTDRFKSGPIGSAVKRNPGPAYYKSTQSSVKKKSFHCNTSKGWM